MSLFSVGTIERFTREGEDFFNVEFPCILDRLALDIVEDTSEYTLPDYVMSIRRVTWKGIKVDPLHFREWKDLNLITTSKGQPREYIFNNIGQLKIKLFPVPNETIATTTNNLWGTSILTKVIVEYYRTSNYSTKTIPGYFKTQLTNAYKFSKLFSIEGKGQNLKAAKYWNSRWLFLKNQYGELLNTLLQGPSRTTIGISSENTSFASPHLSPSNFGVSVGNEDY